MAQWKARLCKLAEPQTMRMVYVLIVIAALALAAGAPFCWGGMGPGG